MDCLMAAEFDCLQTRWTVVDFCIASIRHLEGFMTDITIHSRSTKEVLVFVASRS